MNSATPSACIQAGRRTPPEWGRPVLLRPRGVPRAELLSPRLLLPWLRDVLAPLDTHSPRRTPAATAHTVLSSLLPLSVSVQARSIGRPCGRVWLGSMACVQDSYSGVPLAQLGESVRPGERGSTLRRVWAGSSDRLPSFMAPAKQSLTPQLAFADRPGPHWPGSAGAPLVRVLGPPDPVLGPCAGLNLAAGLAGSENGSARRTRRLGGSMGSPSAPAESGRAVVGQGAGGAV